jgi:para-aminobenzoate synthetase/4-amino-4-deoxychorismate lyase
MTSCVSAKTQAPLADIFAAMFPCASITGAPKNRTMRIIAATETAQRRIYTGSIGHIAPGRRARFNVAIRTVLIDKRRQESEYGVGGGVVWDSTPQGEYEECLLKARVLTTRRPEFSLLETILWTPDDGYWLLSEHLKRFADSAEYFDIRCDANGIVAALKTLASNLPPEPHKVRLLIDRAGRIATEAEPWNESDSREPVRLALAAQGVDSGDVFLYHKTTHRQVYAAAREGCADADDVLLYNQRGEVTETCRANIAVRLGKELITPPVSCGLLAGTYRARLLAEGKLCERVIPLELLAECDELYSLNSVRGLQRAVLVGPRQVGGRQKSNIRATKTN